MKRTKKLLKKKGVTLMEALLVVSVFSIMAQSKIQDVEQEQRNIKAQIIADQLQQIGQATNAYINLNYDKITKLDNVVSGENAPLTCNKNTKTCSISLSSLKNSYLLPKTFQENNILGSNYKINLKIEGSAPNFLINGLIVSNTGVDLKKSKNQLLLGKVIQKAGMDAGFSRTNNEIKGLSGAWSAKTADYADIKQSGQLAYQVGYSSNMYSIYLRRDGTLPMIGNLNLNNNDIVGIKNLTANGNVSSATIKSTTADLQTVNSTTMTGTNINATNLTSKTKFDSSGTNTLTGTTNINGNYFNINATTTKFAKNVEIAGTLTTSGANQFNGQSTFLNTIVATGTTANLGVVNIDKTLTVKGKTSINSELDVGNGQATIKDGVISSKNNINSNYLLPNSISAAGQVCTTNGMISKSNNGELLTCVNLKWSSVSGGGGLGYDQNYNVYTWSRTSGDQLRKPDTDYTNNTDKPLFIIAVSSFGEDQNGRSGYSTLLINGKAIDSGDKMYAIIPVGQRYRIATQGKSKINKLIIKELR